MSYSLKDSVILLVSPQPSHRSSLRKSLCDLGASNKLIEVSPDFNQAKARLTQGAVDIVITDDEFNETQSGMDLIELHEKNNPISRKRLFILMTSQTSPFFMAEFVLRGGDNIINKPFRNEIFINTIKGLVLDRDKMPEEEGLVFDVLDSLKQNDLEKAAQYIANFKNDTCVQAQYSKGKFHEAKQEPDLAYEMFVNVLKKKTDFKTLVSILKTGTTLKKHSELMTFVENWLKLHPIHHSSIPDMTRVIIANKKFDLLDEFFQLFAKNKIEENYAKMSLGAGFVMASSYHLDSGVKDKATAYALKGLEYSCNRFQIMFRAIENLLKAGAKDLAEKAYMQINVDDSTVESKINDLRIRDLIYPKNKVLADCQKLLAEKIKDADLYQITINCLKETGKDPKQMIVEAQRNFPNKVFAS